MSGYRGRKGIGRQCTYIREDGSTCIAWALKSSPEEKPRCRVHSAMDDGTWTETAKAMSRKQQFERRAKTEPKPRSGLDPKLKLIEVLAVIAPALVADDPFVPGLACWPVRLAAAGTLLAAFPGYLRDTPEKVAALLRELLPQELFESEQHQASKVYEAMRESWLAVDGLRWSKLKGLYVKAFPGYCVEPWLSERERVELQATRPKPIPPEQADVLRLPDGTIALRRPGELPLVVPIEEPGDWDFIELTLPEGRTKVQPLRHSGAAPLVMDDEGDEGVDNFEEPVQATG